MTVTNLSTALLENAMRQACAEARRWLGATSPNPAVGAVALNANGTILAVAAHHMAGEKHAEAKLIETLRQQGRLDDVAILCVTLEPCNHYGRTPPCTDAILATGIKHLVIGTRDPNPNVTGGGIARLQQSGISITTEICGEECRQLIAAYAYSVQNERPWITVKRALDTNGSMIPKPGQKTFTSQPSLMLSHRLRKKCDAILTGSGTILADDPLFTVRHIPDFPGKRRWLVILDRRRRVSQTYIDQAAKRGLDVIMYDDATTAMADLHSRGVRDILVEAGPALSQHLFDLDLWTMAVTIQQAETDRIETGFNPRQPIPFAIEQFYWDTFLPSID